MDLVSCTSAEQGLGEKLDGRSDIFWLGVVPYQMATRDLPFSGEAHKAVFSSTLHQLPVPPREHNPKVREELECFITGALAKCRGLGYWSAAVTRDDLSRLVEEKERAFSSPVVVAVEAATVTVAEEPAEPADLAVEREEEGKAASRLFSGLRSAAAGDQKMAVYAAGSESLRVTYPYAVTCRHDLKSLPSELATCVAPSR